MGAKLTIPQNNNSAGLHILNAGVMTGTNTITSAVFQANNMDNLGLQISWTGTPTGTITVECNVDNVTANFIPLTFSPALTQPAGAGGSYLVNLNQLPFPYVRVKYVNASGVGVLDVWLSAKGLN